MFLALPLLLPGAIQIPVSQSVLPLAQVTSLQFVQPYKPPDFYTEVLKPIQASQESIQTSCKATGGTVSGVTCVPPPPVVVSAPPAPTAPTVQSYPTGCSLYEPLVAQYPGWDVSTMMAIMQAESGCNPNAANWSSSCFGLFQVRFDGEAFDPATNVADAYHKFVDQGYGAWQTYTEGTYLQYLR